MSDILGRSRALQLLAQTIRGLFVLPLIQCAHSLPITSIQPLLLDRKVKT